MNRLVIGDVSISHNHLKFNYHIEGAWRKCFIEEQPFIVEYSEDISNIPQSVALIPFVCNVLPIAWIFDAEIILKELDEDFYSSVEKFKSGYVHMHPRINFNGKLTVKNIVQNEQGKNSNNTVALFSGGVDSYYTLLSHIDEKPTLVTLWGADIKLDDHIGWNKVQDHFHNVASAHNLDFIVIKSSFRKFIDGGFLSDYVYPLSSCYWYPDFQHGIGILGHLAPYAFAKMIKTAYIASSFNIQLKGQIPCASDPTIDNLMRFCGCQVVHDGYEFSRQAKIHQITKYVKESKDQVFLRVCWEASGGSNCCRCEKCYRTIMGIIAEGDEPGNYGFNFNNYEFWKMMLDLRSKLREYQDF